MKIIAFDLGSNFAWATNQPKLRWGSFKTKGVRPHRLYHTDRELCVLLHHGHKFDIVVYETPFARGRDATRSLWGLAGIIESRATASNLPVVDVAVPTIKKFATGNGFAAKVDMIKAAQKFGYTGSDEHEADAICLLRYAEANLEKA